MERAGFLGDGMAFSPLQDPVNDVSDAVMLADAEESIDFSQLGGKIVPPVSLGQTSGHDDGLNLMGLFQFDGFENGVSGLLGGLGNEGTGVDDEDIDIPDIIGQTISLVPEDAKEHL
jgi:hypothetical protein